MKKIFCFVLLLLVIGQANADDSEVIDSKGSWFLNKTVDANDKTITYAIHTLSNQNDVFTFSCRIPFYTDPYYNFRYQIASITFQGSSFLSSNSTYKLNIVNNQIQGKQFKVKTDAQNYVKFDRVTDLIDFIQPSSTIKVQFKDNYLFKRVVSFDLDGFSKMERKLDNLCKFETNN